MRQKQENKALAGTLSHIEFQAAIAAPSCKFALLFQLHFFAQATAERNQISLVGEFL